MSRTDTAASMVTVAVNYRCRDENGASAPSVRCPSVELPATCRVPRSLHDAARHKSDASRHDSAAVRRRQPMPGTVAEMERKILARGRATQHAYQAPNSLAETLAESESAGRCGVSLMYSVTPTSAHVGAACATRRRARLRRLAGRRHPDYRPVYAALPAYAALPPMLPAVVATSCAPTLANSGGAARELHPLAQRSQESTIMGARALALVLALALALGQQSSGAASCGSGSGAVDRHHRYIARRMGASVAPAGDEPTDNHITYSPPGRRRVDMPPSPRRAGGYPLANYNFCSSARSGTRQALSAERGVRSAELRLYGN